MLREAHRIQFSAALEVAGSRRDERPPSPLRVNRARVEPVANPAMSAAPLKAECIQSTI
jgi:hypothetical protein